MARHHEQMSTLETEARALSKNGTWAEAGDKWSALEAIAKAHNEKGYLSIASKGLRQSIEMMAQDYVKGRKPSTEPTRRSTVQEDFHALFS